MASRIVSSVRSLLPRASQVISSTKSAQEVAGVRGFAASASPGNQAKVVVFGGNGYVGSYVCKSLLSMGVAVTSINRSGQITYPEWDHWWHKVNWVKGDALEPEEWKDKLAGATGVVSCVGAFGSNAYMEKVCGDATVSMVEAAKAAKVKNFVFISAHDYQLPSFVLSGYVAGKKKAEEAVASHFPTSGFSLRPGFIHGTRYVNGVPVFLSTIGGPLETALRGENAMNLLESQPKLATIMVPPTKVEDVASVAAQAAATGAGAGIPVGPISAWDIPKYAM
uniref:NAD(P)-binding domain-containing protein n=1 Tax=Pyramimonas obovata TaxID=1411642 RepID=A0A7S0WUV3_9CHLO|eukprot:CAMPEP_0118936790 /NCGR_PEP_ID=MMETSP1169-20130426/20460_1 /TAXON_ID=36882 /ORGANISM="Pyramimonas obovata, Strain CCMP722" /LENGTH=279 /DNA_ID=CAMNT_0006880181 /DNA_START=46 /DNA_END=885 /DNA_ORIENTATION=-